MKKLSYLFLVAMAMSLIGCNKPGANTSGDESSQPTSSETKNEHDVDIDVGPAPQFDEPAVFFHYWRKDCKYAGWDMWLWEKDHDGGAYAFNAKDDWGVIAAYPLSTWVDPEANSLGFIVRKGGDSWADKDLGGNDKFLNFSEFEKDENDIYHVYLISGKTDIYTDPNGTVKGRITMATFATETRIAVNTNLQIQAYKLYESGDVIKSSDSAGRVKRLDLDIPHECDYAKKYQIEVKFIDDTEASATVSKTLLFGGERFGQLYNYEGEDLGVTLSGGKTIFKVWSPLSDAIDLRIYESGTPAVLGGNDSHLEYHMEKGEKGVFEYTINERLDGFYYTYVVYNDTFNGREIVDPYAKSAGVNGVRGAIIDISTINPVGWADVNVHQYDRKSLVVYETHVCDVTSSSTWTGSEANRKLFTGMYEEGTTYEEDGVTVTTGFDHIKELGVNAVQIIPLYDQANDEINKSFNWGYNPLNYNVVEGSYSSDPYNAEVRVREFKGLVQAYNEAGINIIMDVVYNHVAGAQGCNFDVLCPGYYFRYNGSGDYSNGSGCGNETASENYMMRKFMIDSIKFWAKEYKLGGFRFDLMGLHDLETMKQLTAAAKEINPSIAIYGEPWTGGTSPLPEDESAKQINGNRYVGYGAFNDQMRDALIKGGLSGPEEVGWITNNVNSISQADMTKLTRGIVGTTSAGTVIADPDKTTNYVTCHDNRTLYDRFLATKRFNEDQDDMLAKMNVLANAVVLTSQGTSFMLAGEEFLRTKHGNDNSYNASYYINELDYSLKCKHMPMVEAYKKLINLKTSLGALHMDAAHAADIRVNTTSDNSMVSYILEDTATNTKYLIIHANGLSSSNVVDLGGYTNVWSSIYGDSKVGTTNTSVEKYETIVASVLMS